MITHRDAAEAEAEYGHLGRWVSRFERPLVFLLRPFRRWILRSNPNRVGRVDRLRAQGKRKEAFELAMISAPEALLRKGFFARANSFFWWAQTFNAASLAETPEEQRRVVALLESAPEPGGMYEAQTLDQLSRWRWRAGNKLAAIAAARCATAADPTWPDSRLALAFYLLRTGVGNPVTVLVEAARIDPKCVVEIEEHFEPAIVSAVHAALKPN